MLRRSLLFLGLLACTPPPAPQPEPPAPPAPPATAMPAPSADPVVEAAPPDGTPCGALDCRQFDTPEQAFAAVLAHKPSVLAIGEAHAQRGSDVASSTKRFTEQLLPMLGERASDLVIELLDAGGKCGKVEKKVAEAQKPVTQKQKQSNQNEFLVLGHASKKLGIQPHVLRPTCDDYLAIVKAGPDGIPRMLEMIAKLTDDLVKRILERNAKQSVDRMVVAYGGAMHNDLAPREGREPWSFGPSLRDHTKGGFIELDLFVPEFIKDSGSWTSFAWYPHYDRDKLGDKVTLFKTGEGAYTMILSQSATGTTAPAPP